MARTFNVYPKAVLLPTPEWRLVLKWIELGADRLGRIVHSEAASVTPAVPLTLARIILDIEVADTDDETDISDLFLVDDIRPGPQVETLWGNFRDTAEARFATLTEPYTAKDYARAWRPQDINKVVGDFRTGISNRGWTITFEKF